MIKSVLAAGLLLTTTFAGVQVSAQTFQNGPYYANPSWDQQIPAGQRFIVLSNWGNVAVLDRETGLVWQRSPDSTRQKANWFTSNSDCHVLGTDFVPGVPVGNRLGWRLPSVEELASLVDPAQSNPALPAGHPFQGIQNGNYWTTTTVEGGGSTLAFIVNFFQSPINHTLIDREDTTTGAFYWCVRGGSSVQNPQ